MSKSKSQCFNEDCFNGRKTCSQRRHHAPPNCSQKHAQSDLASHLMQSFLTLPVSVTLNEKQLGNAGKYLIETNGRDSNHVKIVIKKSSSALSGRVASRKAITSTGSSTEPEKKIRREIKKSMEVQATPSASRSLVRVYNRPPIAYTALVDSHHSSLYNKLSGTIGKTSGDKRMSVIVDPLNLGKSPIQFQGQPSCWNDHPKLPATHSRQFSKKRKRKSKEVSSGIRRVCSSMQFDVTEAKTGLRNKIEHPNREVAEQLRELGVDAILRACRPAKCCRQAVLNEKSDAAMPYSASLRSLPLSPEDVATIKKSLRSGELKTEAEAKALKEDLSYYVDLGMEDELRYAKSYKNQEKKLYRVEQDKPKSRKSSTKWTSFYNLLDKLDTERNLFDMIYDAGGGSLNRVFNEPSSYERTDSMNKVSYSASAMSISVKIRMKKEEARQQRSTSNRKKSAEYVTEKKRVSSTGTSMEKQENVRDCPKVVGRKEMKRLKYCLNLVDKKDESKKKSPLWNIPKFYEMYLNRKDKVPMGMRLCGGKDMPKESHDDFVCLCCRDLKKPQKLTKCACALPHEGNFTRHINNEIPVLTCATTGCQLCLEQIKPGTSQSSSSDPLETCTCTPEKLLSRESGEAKSNESLDSNKMNLCWPGPQITLTLTAIKGTLVNSPSKEKMCLVSLKQSTPQQTTPQVDSQKSQSTPQQTTPQVDSQESQSTPQQTTPQVDSQKSQSTPQQTTPQVESQSSQSTPQQTMPQVESQTSQTCSPCGKPRPSPMSSCTCQTEEPETRRAKRCEYWPDRCERPRTKQVRSDERAAQTATRQTRDRALETEREPQKRVSNAQTVNETPRPRRQTTTQTLRDNSSSQMECTRRCCGESRVSPKDTETPHEERRVRGQYGSRECADGSPRSSEKTTGKMRERYSSDGQQESSFRRKPGEVPRESEEFEEEASTGSRSNGSSRAVPPRSSEKTTGKMRERYSSDGQKESSFRRKPSDAPRESEEFDDEASTGSRSNGSNPAVPPRSSEKTTGRMRERYSSDGQTESSIRRKPSDVPRESVEFEEEASAGSRSNGSGRAMRPSRVGRDEVEMRRTQYRAEYWDDDEEEPPKQPSVDEAAQTPLLRKRPPRKCTVEREVQTAAEERRSAYYCDKYPKYCSRPPSTPKPSPRPSSSEPPPKAAGKRGAQAPCHGRPSTKDRDEYPKDRNRPSSTPKPSPRPSSSEPPPKPERKRGAQAPSQERPYTEDRDEYPKDRDRPSFTPKPSARPPSSELPSRAAEKREVQFNEKPQLKTIQPTCSGRCDESDEEAEPEEHLEEEFNRLPPPILRDYHPKKLPSEHLPHLDEDEEPLHEHYRKRKLSSKHQPNVETDEEPINGHHVQKSRSKLSPINGRESKPEPADEEPADDHHLRKSQSKLSLLDGKGAKPEPADDDDDDDEDDDNDGELLYHHRTPETIETVPHPFLEEAMNEKDEGDEETTRELSPTELSREKSAKEQQRDSTRESASGLDKNQKGERRNSTKGSLHVHKVVTLSDHIVEIPESARKEEANEAPEEQSTEEEKQETGGEKEEQKPEEKQKVEEEQETEEKGTDNGKKKDKKQNKKDSDVKQNRSLENEEKQKTEEEQEAEAEGKDNGEEKNKKQKKKNSDVKQNKSLENEEKQKAEEEQEAEAEGKDNGEENNKKQKKKNSDVKQNKSFENGEKQKVEEEQEAEERGTDNGKEKDKKQKKKDSDVKQNKSLENVEKQKAEEELDAEERGTDNGEGKDKKQKETYSDAKQDKSHENGPDRQNRNESLFGLLPLTEPKKRKTTKTKSKPPAGHNEIGHQKNQRRDSAVAVDSLVILRKHISEETLCNKKDPEAPCKTPCKKKKHVCKHESCCPNQFD